MSWPTSLCPEMVPVTLANVTELANVTGTISGHSDYLMHVPRAKYNLVRIRPAGSALVLALLH